MSIAVVHSTEFDRVATLPRRSLTIELAREWAAALTPIFALREGAALRPWQAMALAEAVDNGGAFLGLPVGQGKTILTFLLPTAMQSERALLIVPKTLQAKTYANFASYDGVWRSPSTPLRVESRERLSTIGGVNVLVEYAPDLIIIDESDDLSNPDSACVRRIDRYVRAANPRVVTMTGTPSRKSIMGYWHLLAWTLGDRAPVPLVHEEALMWALAIDDRRGVRPKPGPLGSSLRAARAWYCRRLVETPGVVIVDEDSCDAPLRVRVRLSQEDSGLDAAYERFLVEQENPGGIPVSDPLSRWLLDGQLGLRLYTRWNPPPPEEWRSARRAIARFVRERIDASTYSDHPIDTEAQVLRRYKDLPIVRDWREIKPTFKGKTETVWLSRGAIEDCLAWLSESPAAGIVWCGNVDFARELSRASGLRYYGRKGRSESGTELYAAPPGESFIASWNANKKGFDLQPWTRQLVTMPPASAKWLEQIFGRSHRAGQTEPVTVDVLATSGGTLDLVEAAISEARGVRERTTLTQKILRADITRARPVLTASNEFRWARKQQRTGDES